MNTSAKNSTLVFIPCFSGAPWSAEQLALYGDAPKRTLRLPEGVNDIERYADHVESAVADLDDFVLVGDSCGANIALALATRHPPPAGPVRPGPVRRIRGQPGRLQAVEGPDAGDRQGPRPVLPAADAARPRPPPRLPARR
ncbi:alpha/beta fold hydrolase [Kitasatospora sp. NPDC017646]|uniref:alpha/beta fold hydrolase n=1 Tax=Kitasatospora sp. NPDC017646 TaxID=3364024 RepID=UPI00378E7451